MITADLDSVTIDISYSTKGIGIGSLVRVFTGMSSNGLAAMAGFWEVEKIMGPHLVAVPLDMRVMPEAFGSAIVYPLEYSELLTRVAPGYAKSGDRHYADKKYDKAAKAYTLAAKMGHANSMVRLGMMYDWGLHFPIDNERAVFWYAKAAILNHPSGIYHLGLMMSKGEGIKKDLPRARNLFAKSAAMDDPYSQFNLGVCYYEGLGGKKDHAKALQWFEKAAAHKIKEAFFAMGIMYEKGQGVDQDRIKAVSYYKRAADMGDGEVEDEKD